MIANQKKPMKQSRSPWLLTLSLISVLEMPLGAALVFSEDFSDGDISPFLSARNGGVTVVSVIDDSAGIGSGNALLHEPNRTTNTFLTSSFSDVVLGAANDFISLTFDVRLQTNVTSSEDLRFGLYNDGGTAITVSGGANSTATDDDSGYLAQFDTGVAAGNNARLFLEVAGDTILGGSGNDFLTDNDSAAAITTSTSTISLVITRNADDTFNTEMLLNGSSLFARNTNATETPLATNTFNQIVFGSNGADLDLIIDNVTVETNVIPEPTTSAFGMLTFLFALFRMRKR